MSIAPPTDAKRLDLERRMVAMGIRESDLLEEFVRGSGAGGQKINKTSSTVWLKHLPSGIEVRCQATRSQAQNRFLARRLLVEKLEEIVLKAQSQKQQEREKVRRQKRKRSKRAKAKMLDDKKHHGDKKSMRRRPQE